MKYRERQWTESADGKAEGGKKPARWKRGRMRTVESSDRGDGPSSRGSLSARWLETGLMDSYDRCADGAADPAARLNEMCPAAR